MNVKEMIHLMKTLGIGESFSDESSQRIALQYLNLANDEIYRETAMLNSDILVKDVLTSDPAESFITLTETPFAIAAVFPVGQTVPLKGMGALDFATYEFLHPSVGTPQIYYKKKNIVNFYPVQGGVAYPFNIWYAPERTALAENTTEDEIPYPISYHSVLVDGALYYLFQDESGFRNPQKENEALRRYTKTKDDLIAYLKGSNHQLITTFNNA